MPDLIISNNLPSIPKTIDKNIPKNVDRSNFLAEIRNPKIKLNVVPKPPKTDIAFNIIEKDNNNTSKILLNNKINKNEKIINPMEELKLKLKNKNNIKEHNNNFDNNNSKKPKNNYLNNNE